MNTKLKKILYALFMPLLIIYFETVLKAVVYDTVFNEGFIFMCLFSLPIGLFFNLLVTSFSEKTNKYLFVALISCLTIYYAGQMIYYKIFSTFASLYFIIGAGKAAQFYKVLIDAIINNLLPLMFILFPIIAVAVFHKKVYIRKISKNYIIKVAVFAAAMQLSAVMLVLSSDEGMLSASYLYKDAFLVKDSIDKFGLLTTGRLDIKNILKNSNAFASESKPIEILESREDEDKVEVEVEMGETVEQVVEEYNLLDIPYEELIANEGKEGIRSLHEYFKNAKPSKKNKYTGMFKDKNLILITAEGFSPYAVHKELTPTLYKMYEEGFKFTDFYTPLWGVSTSDGEYVACTGLLPKEGIWSFYKSSENYMPLSMGNQLKNVGYETYAYHNHYYNYYFRDKSHPNMGYIYKGLGNGLDVTETWPESDVEMIELTVDEYINKQPFHAYYMTVSGHLQYTFTGNYIAAKNKMLVENLEYSDNVKAYLACNIELDKAMEKLIARLEEAGIADDTLIAISPDHYPYGLTKAEISELAGHEVDSDFELYKGVFLLWSEGMEPVEISKTSSSLDIIPTLSNLMGIDYDSRLLMGTDILSDTEPLVMFQDRSWITDKAYFNAKTGQVTMQNGFMVDDSYITEISEKVKQKFKVSAMILDYDYYKIVFNKK
ncbi:MAG: LTA synthase family protein [Sedimentibacter sp.]